MSGMLDVESGVRRQEGRVGCEERCILIVWPLPPGYESFQRVIITIRTKLGSEIKQFLPLRLSDFLHWRSHDLVPLAVINRTRLFI